MNNRIAYLIESELERAEIILAAKSLTDDLQDMAEKVAKMDAEDAMPLSDPMRTQFGADAAGAFAATVAGKLRELTEKIREVRDAIGSEIAKLEGDMNGEPVNDIMTADPMANEPEDDFSMDEPEAPEDEVSDEVSDDLDTVDLDDFDLEIDDTKHAAGRARKESVETNKKVLENTDQRITKEFSMMIKEGKTVEEAAHSIMETYALPLQALVEIVSKKKS